MKQGLLTITYLLLGVALGSLGYLGVMAYELYACRDISPGNTYLFSFEWDARDPFKEIDIDTIKVLDVRDGYVQWQYPSGIKQSSTARTFKKLTKPLSND